MGLGMNGLKCLSEEDLKRSIDQKRKEMFRVASIRGISNIETVKSSKELDILILYYQKYFMN